MSRLVLCSACLRHVREDDASCPFCATARGAQEPAGAESTSTRVASVSARAAILFFGAVATGACGDRQANDNTNIVVPYGAPPRPDPTPSPTPSPTPTPTQPVAVPPYGVAPIPTPTPEPEPSSAPKSSGSSAASSAQPAQTVSSPVRIVPPYGAPPPPPPPPKDPKKK